MGVPRRVRLICAWAPVRTLGIRRMLGLMYSMCGAVRVSESVVGTRPRRMLGLRRNGLRRVAFLQLRNESSGPLLDHFVEVSGCVYRCSTEFAYLFLYVLFLCLS